MLLSLIGYRGSGKTTVAQAVALRLAWDWVDADVEIELRAGKSIAAIFADHGEEHFRDLESAVLKELMSRDRTVLAFGGGIVLRDANRQLLIAASHEGRGKTAWLKASPEALWERIVADTTTAVRRPNLTAGGGLEEVKVLLAQREPHYRKCADWIVETDAKSLAKVADEIVGWLQDSIGAAAGPGGHG
jgi:shikimate kinase